MATIHGSTLLLMALAAVVGCGGGPTEESAGADAAAVETLPVPFTSAEIRDEWVEGLSLLFRFRSPGREETQHWTVVAADAEGAEIQYMAVDPQGQPVAEPQRARSSWDELRDHALFPAADAERSRVTRDTHLGTLEGWLYLVRDPAAETVTRFFFSDRHPGAPIWMESRRGEQVLLEVTQIGRRRPGELAEGDPETAPEPG